MNEEKTKNRDELGRFIIGTIANPTGKNGCSGMPDLMTRQKYFEERYTVKDLQDLIKDKKRFGNLTVTDAQIVTHLAASIAGGKDRGKERERYYDRKYGKPKQTTELQGVDGKALIPDRTAESSRTVEAIASELARAKRSSVE